MNLLRISARSGARLARYRPVQARCYSTQHASARPNGSNTPWVIGSLVVFGPLLFNLTSPPPSKKKHVEPAVSHAAPSPVVASTPAPAPAPAPVAVVEAKPIQKPYVLVGAGTASFAAAQAIKEKDPEANVVIIGDEGYAPYMRPPLSKELWFSEDPEVSKTLVFRDWQGQERSALYQDADQYEIIEDASGSDLKTSKIKLLLNKRVKKIGVEDHTATLADGSVIYYHKILLATGGEPKMLAHDANAGAVTNFRTVSDFEKLDSLVRSGAHVAIIGGGFLGSELAVALAHRANKGHSKVSQVFIEEGNMANVFPSYLTKWTTNRVRQLGVDVRANSKIESISSTPEGKVSLQLGGDETLTVDHVVMAVGIEPRVDLAREAGLEIDEKRLGVVVNAELEARKDVFAAGDMVSFHDIQLGRRRIEHHDHAVLSGRHAGENMVGAAKAYRHQSMFWSDLGPEVGYEAVGLIDARLSTVSVWAKATAEDTPAAKAGGNAVIMPQVKSLQDEKFGKGLVFYVRDNKIVGLLLFNVFGKVQEARDIIQAGCSSDKIDGLINRFNLHDKE